MPEFASKAASALPSGTSSSVSNSRRSHALPPVRSSMNRARFSRGNSMASLNRRSSVSQSWCIPRADHTIPANVFVPVELFHVRIAHVTGEACLGRNRRIRLAAPSLFAAPLVAVAAGREVFFQFRRALLPAFALCAVPLAHGSSLPPCTATGFYAQLQQ